MGLLSNVLNRVSQFELTMLIVTITILITLYATVGYLRAVILCFKLNGPPARFFFGNILLLLDENSNVKTTFEFQLKLNQNLFSSLQ